MDPTNRGIHVRPARRCRDRIRDFLGVSWSASLVMLVGMAVLPSVAGGSTDGTAHVQPPLVELFDAANTLKECGARSLHVMLALNANGRRPPYSQLRSELGEGADGTSPGRMVAVANRWGLELETVYAPPESIHSFPLPAIVHLWLTPEKSADGHYVVLLDVNETDVTFVETALSARLRRMSRAEFGRFASGYALTKKRPSSLWMNLGLGATLATAYLFFVASTSRQKLLPMTLLVAGIGAGLPGCGSQTVEQPPYIPSPKRASPLVSAVTAHDIGVVGPQSQVPATFTVSNSSSRAVDIRVVQTSCACVNATVDDPTLGPGASTVVRTKIHAEETSLPGPLAVEVRVAAIDTVGDGGVLVLKLFGVVRGLRTERVFLRVPASLQGWAPEPIRGEFYLDRQVAGNAAIEIAEVGWIGRNAPQGIAFGDPVISECLDRGDHSVRRVVIPLTVESTARPPSGEYHAVIRYRAGAEEGKHEFPLIVVEALDE